MSLVGIYRGTASLLMSYFTQHSEVNLGHLPYLQFKGCTVCAYYKMLDIVVGHLVVMDNVM